jgi:hypothetical protein
VVKKISDEYSEIMFKPNKQGEFDHVRRNPLQQAADSNRRITQKTFERFWWCPIL